MASIGFQPADRQPIQLRKRPDLIIREHPGNYGSTYIVKDPVSLQYFHLREAEHTVLTHLDGKSAWQDIKEMYDRKFAPQKMQYSQLMAFLAKLHQEGLVYSNAKSQLAYSSQRRTALRHSWWFERFGNPLAIRFRGVDPERFLGWLHGYFQWLFSKRCLMAWCTLIFLCALLFAVKSNIVIAKLPDIYAFLTSRNIYLLAIALASTKVLHELGHGLTCRHYGGECHEIGLMLLAGVPCLYCDVSDSWLLQERWKRVAIAAAGMIFELGLAAVCGIVWLYSEAGLFSTLCFCIMVTSSVATVLFNGNPLLRYDGYFILSDLLKMPNLSSRSSNALHRWIAWLSLGIRLPGDSRLGVHQDKWLLVYAILSLTFRCAVIAGILIWVHSALASHRLQVIGQGITCLVLISFVVPTMTRFTHLLSNPMTRSNIHRGRLITFLLVIAFVIVGILLVPLPAYVAGPVEILPRDAQFFYAQLPGLLVKSVDYGKEVREGETIVELVNFETKATVLKLEAELERRQQLLSGLFARRGNLPEIEAQLPAARQAVQDIAARTEAYQKDAARLNMVSPISGKVLPPPTRKNPLSSKELPRWSGLPLDPINRGCFVEAGTLLCLIAEENRLDAVAVVDQSDVHFIDRGQKAKIELAAFPGQVFTGSVTDIAAMGVGTLSPAILAEGAVPQSEDVHGSPQPAQTNYYVRVEIPRLDLTIPLYSRGEIKIIVESQSLGSRALRLLSDTFPSIN